jgi:hypothetical protein
MHEVRFNLHTMMITFRSLSDAVSIVAGLCEKKVIEEFVTIKFVGRTRAKLNELGRAADGKIVETWSTR